MSRASLLEHSALSVAPPVVRCRAYATNASKRSTAPVQCVATGSSRQRASELTSRPVSKGAAPAATSASSPPPLRIPRSLGEVDNGKILGFGADLSEDHPGFKDAAYKQRRVDICNAARAHRVGQPIPPVHYTLEETAVWGRCLGQLEELFPRLACAEFQRCYPLFSFTPDRIPQLEELSQVLQRTTGWRIRPVAGLLHPRDFLNGLAFRTFHSTQYIRHPSRPDYTPEPDVVHELLGHVPMLADPAFCDLVHQIGVASLGADDKEIWHLTKLYWYTVEFGVVRESGNIKAFGAGILSSYGELQHMAAGAATLEPFDPFKPQPKMSYKDGFQLRYFVLESFEDGAAMLKAYCRALHHQLPADVLRAVA